MILWRTSLITSAENDGRNEEKKTGTEWEDRDEKEKVEDKWKIEMRELNERSVDYF